MHRIGLSLRSRWTPLLLHCLLAFPIILAAWLGASPGFTLVAGAVLLLVGYPFVTVFEMRLTPLVLGPLSYFLVWQWLILGVAGLWKGLAVLGGTRLFPFSTAMVSAEDLTAGFAMYLLGVLMFHAGATILRPLPTATMAQTEGAFPGRRYAALWLAGNVALGLQAPLAWTGLLLRIFATAPLVALCALAVRGRPGRRLSQVSLVLLLIGSSIVFVLGLLGGSKSLAMLSLLPFAWAALRSRWAARNIVALGAGFALLYGGLVYPLVSAARASSYGGFETIWYSPAGILDTKDEVFREDLDWSRTADEFFDRIFAPTPVGFLVSQVRANGLRYGETMEYLYYALIPRFVWWDKPMVTRGRWFDVYLRGDSESDTHGNSLGQTATGELFWNFGVGGAILGMFSSGLVFGWLWRIAGTDPREKVVRMMLYVNLLLVAPSMMEIEWGSGFVGLLYRLLLFSLLLKIFALRTTSLRFSNVAGLARS